MRPPDHSPPGAMAAETGALCAHVRRDAGSLYGQLLRENVLDVLRSSFPAFSARFSKERLEEAASAFLAVHPASRPQFHHIATEFVDYAQGYLALAPMLLGLLEYEWALLTVEIDPARVVSAEIVPRNLREAMRVVLNPTARLVVLPLELLQSMDGDAADQDGRCCACAIYRTGAHGVVTRPLTYEDCLLIDALGGGEGIAFGALARIAQNQIPETDVRQWVADGAACDLLQIDA